MKPAHEREAPRTRIYSRRHATLARAASAAAGLSLLAAGCGGGSGPSVATIGTTTTTAATTAAASAASSTSANTLLTKLVHFAGCMRSHGLADFPDPTNQNGSVRLVIRPGSGINPSSPSFKRAEKACASLLPTKGEIEALVAKEIQQRLPGMLSFSKCMRRHGVAGFPDPSSQQGLTLKMIQTAGIDVRSPSVLAAAKTCLPASHGAITGAQLKRAEQQAAQGGN